MTQTLLSERKLSLTKLAQREGVNISTAWRWALRGVRGVKLATFSAGGRRFTTEEAYGRFCESITAITVGDHGATVPTRTNRAGSAAMSQAEAELAKLGA